MKLCAFLSLFFLSLAPATFAENAIPVGGAPEESPSARGSVQFDESRLGFILEESSVKGKYDQCKAMFESDVLNEDVSKCLWDGKIKDSSGVVTTDPNSPLKLVDSEKEEVTALVESGGGEAPANINEDKFESLDTGFFKEAERDPAFKALNEHMAKKLRDTIYGEGEKGKLKVADHMVYHELYKSQISKTVIQAMSSYCLDSEADDKYLIPDKSGLKTARTKNIDRLKDSTMEDQTDEKTGVVTKVPTAKYHFQKCIGSLKDICYGTSSYGRLSGIDVSSLEGINANLLRTKPTNYQDTIDSNNKEIALAKKYQRSKTRACNVTTYIKQLKQNIIAVDDIQKKVEALGIKAGQKGAGLSLGLSGQKLEVFDEKKIEKLTSMSSKEVMEEAKFKETVEAEQEEFAKCMDDNKKIIDPAACEKFLNDNRDEAKKLLVEADLRSRALEKRIKDKVQGEEGVSKYLTDQGYTEEEIEKMKSDPSLIADIEKQINDRFKAEREAYIEAVRKKLSSKTIEDDKGFSDPTGDAVSKLSTIREELASKTERYTELIHFNNIVSGFIDTENSKGEKGANTTGMALELAGSAYGNTDPRGPASGGGDAHIEAVKENLKSSGIEAKIQETANSLQQKEINDILQYEGVKE